MKLLLIFTLLITSVFFLNSCQREVDGIIANRIESDSTLLSKYVELDTTLPSGSDTTLKTTYTYDSQKRLQQSSSTNYLFGNTNTIIYLYAGTDTLPIKCIQVATDLSDTYRDTIFLSYMNGYVSLDSTIEYNITSNQFVNTSVISFTPNGNNTFIKARNYFLPGISPVSEQWSGMITKTYQNGNIVMQDDTSTFHIRYTNRAHHQVSYDNKINPFYKIPVRYPVLNNLGFQKNNDLEETSWDVPSTITEHYQYTYTYNAKGYPVSVIVADVLNPPNKYKALFFYNN